MQNYFLATSIQQATRSVCERRKLSRTGGSWLRNDRLTTLEPISERHQTTKFVPRQSKESIAKDNCHSINNPNTKVTTATHRLEGQGSSSRIRFASSEQARAMNSQQQRPPAHDSARRSFDIVIFAASGRVGQFLVEELALVAQKHHSSLQLGTGEQSTNQNSRRQSVPSSKQSGNDIRWAIAGRSAMRLNETLCRAELSTGIRDLSQQVPVLLADLNQRESLVNLCKQTKSVINCAGPYSELGGDLLISSAIEAGANYLDLSHETNFNELVRRKFSERAKRAGVFILQGCGFQSMSSELGLNFTKQIADGQIEQIKIVLTLSESRAATRSLNDPSMATEPVFSLGDGIVSLGMWHSLLVDKAQDGLLWPASSELDEQQTVECIDEARNVEEDRCQLIPERRLKRKDTQNLVKDMIEFRNRSSLSSWWPPLKFIQNSLIQGLLLFSPGRSLEESLDSNSPTNNTRNGYTWPINYITSEESQLSRSEMINYELRRPDLNSQNRGWRPIQCSNFISIKSFKNLILFCFWLFLFRISVKFSLARRIMRSFPRLLTLNHVNSNYCSAPINSRISNCQSYLDRASLSHIKFSQTFLAYGTPNDESGDPLEKREPKDSSRRSKQQLLVARIVGPEPNHVATATYAIQAALTLMLEKDHLPRSTNGQAGGVLTPGAAFVETNIIYQLRKRNIKFEVLKKA